MAYHREKVKAGLFRLTAFWLCQKRWPHLWMFLACGAGFAAWWSLCQVLAPIRLFPMRYALCAIGAYTAWFLMLGLWFILQRRADSACLIEEVNRASWNRPLTPHEERRMIMDMTRDGSDQFFQHLFADPRSAVGFLLFMMLGGGVLVALFLFCVAPRFLAEFLVVGGKISHGTVCAPVQKNWHAHLLDQTRWFGAALVIHYTLVAWAAQAIHPNALGLLDALKP